MEQTILGLCSRHAPLANRYANMKGLVERGYTRMQRVENSLVSYLVPGAADPGPISRLMWAGQECGALHTMSVLQAYKADLLKDLNLGEGVSQNAYAPHPQPQSRFYIPLF